MAKEQKIIDNNLDAYQRFQEATRYGAEARAEILKGIPAGVPLEDLLTIAADCIAHLCDNQFFADQVRTLLKNRSGIVEAPMDSTVPQAETVQEPAEPEQG